MESDSFVKSKAEYLVNYIVAKYGLSDFGNFRVLSSIGEFREEASRCNMISFEKILREQHGTYWTRTPNNTRVVCGPNETVFDDDSFGSALGATINRARAVYPEYNHFRCGPAVQGGHGVDVASVIADFDSEMFSAVVQTLADKNPQMYRESVDNYLHHVAQLGGENMSPIVPYEVFESVHSLLVIMRADGELLTDKYPFEHTGEKLPVATPMELPEVISGGLRKCVKMPKPCRAVLEGINAFYHGEGDISEDDTELIFFDRFDPFSVVGSRVFELPLIEKIEPGKFTVKKKADRPLIEQKSATVKSFQPVATTSCDNLDFTAALSLIAHYYNIDVGRLPAHEKIVAHYGSEKGQETWLKLSKSSRGKFLAQYAADKRYSIAEWFTIGCQFITTHARTHGLDAGDMRLLVAGRTVAYKGQLCFGIEDDPPFIMKNP